VTVCFSEEVTSSAVQDDSATMSDTHACNDVCSITSESPCRTNGTDPPYKQYKPFQRGVGSARHVSSVIAGSQGGATRGGLNQVSCDEGVFASNRLQQAVVNEGFRVTNHSTTVDNEGYRVTNHSTTVDNEGYRVTNHSTTVDNEGYRVTNHNTTVSLLVTLTVS